MLTPIKRSPHHIDEAGALHLNVIRFSKHIRKWRGTMPLTTTLYDDRDVTIVIGQ